MIESYSSINAKDKLILEIAMKLFAYINIFRNNFLARDVLEWQLHQRMAYSVQSIQNKALPETV